MFVLLGAVGLVLLIVCVNVASLVLIRGVSRGRELAVRVAVGAGRFSLFRGLLIESLVLGITGGAAGLVLAYWATTAIASLDPSIGVPLLNQTRLDVVVVAFAFGRGAAGGGAVRDHARLARDLDHGRGVAHPRGSRQHHERP